MSVFPRDVWGLILPYLRSRDLRNVMACGGFIAEKCADILVERKLWKVDNNGWWARSWKFWLTEKRRRLIHEAIRRHGRYSYVCNQHITISPSDYLACELCDGCIYETKRRWVNTAEKNNSRGNKIGYYGKWWDYEVTRHYGDSRCPSWDFRRITNGIIVICDNFNDVPKWAQCKYMERCIDAHFEGDEEKAKQTLTPFKNWSRQKLRRIRPRKLYGRNYQLSNKDYFAILHRYFVN